MTFWPQMLYCQVFPRKWPILMYNAIFKYRMNINKYDITVYIEGICSQHLGMCKCT